MADSFDVSHIVTVYNKEKYLPDTVASLLNQEGGLTREFIFVDDLSTDRSLSVIEEAAKGVPNVAIVRNSDNRGPSVRLNQGARLARGKYLHFLDSDDMVPADAIAFMHRALEESGADFLYGTWKKTGLPGKELRNWRIGDTKDWTLHHDPLIRILKGRFRRMCLLAKRELFEAVGGCDEGVFIQDESLPLRLAVQAHNMAVITAAVNLVPLTEENLSGNKSQLNHDRFMAYRNALISGTNLPPRARRLMYRKCFSAYWKEVRAQKGIAAHFMPLFIEYGWVKWIPTPANFSRLDTMTMYFRTLPGVRRCL